MFENASTVVMPDTRLILLSFFVVVFFMLTSCATLTEEEQYARADSLNVAIDQFQARQQACNEAGGAMQMNAGGQKLRKRFTRHDYVLARCVRLF